MKTVKRDRQKILLSKKNDVKLVFINYWEVINQKLFRSKINESTNII